MSNSKCACGSSLQQIGAHRCERSAKVACPAASRGPGPSTWPLARAGLRAHVNMAKGGLLSRPDRAREMHDTDSPCASDCWKPPRSACTTAIHTIPPPPPPLSLSRSPHHSIRTRSFTRQLVLPGPHAQITRQKDDDDWIDLHCAWHGVARTEGSDENKAIIGHSPESFRGLWERIMVI